MSRSYTPPHYSAVGIQLMGHMFEQQVRIAHALGMAAIATNPLLPRTPSSAAPKAVRSATQMGAMPARQTRAPSAPPPMPAPVRRTHSMPV